MLLQNYRQIMRKAWSFRLIILSGLLSGIEVAMPVLREAIEPLQVVPTGTFALATILTTAAAGIARIVAQPKAGL